MNQKSLNFIKQISFEVSALQNIKDVEEYLKHVKQDSDKFKHLIAYAKAISLFTGGNVDSVRDPNNFEDILSKNWGSMYNSALLKQIFESFPEKEKILLFNHENPDLRDYQNSHEIISYLANTNSIPNEFFDQTKTLYRGIYNVSPSKFLGMCKPEEVYSIGKISSTSIRISICKNFILTRSPWKLVYELDNSKAKRGAYAMNVTSAFPHESEIILGGNIKVKSFEFEPQWKSFDNLGTSSKEILGGRKQFFITDFDELIWYVNIYEKVRRQSQLKGAPPRRVREIEPGYMHVYGEII